MTLVVDTSALMSVVLGELDASPYAAVLSRNAGDVTLSAVTAVEAAIVAEARLGAVGALELQTLLGAVGAVTAPVDAAQAALAVGAWRRFGKGRHPAALNLGDCFSYALAMSLRAPLLFKGRDFPQTDVATAL